MKLRHFVIGAALFTCGITSFCQTAVAAKPQSPASAPQSAKDSKKIAQIRQLIELVGTRNLLNQQVQMQARQLKQVAPQMPPEFWQRLEKELDVNQLIELFIPIYDKYYTEEEVASLVKFYQSPIGKKLVTTLPKVSEESAAAGKEWGEALGERIVKDLIKEGYNPATGQMEPKTPDPKTPTKPEPPPAKK